MPRFFLLFMLFSTLVFGQSAEETALFQKGKSAYQAGDYLSAESHFIQLLDLREKRYTLQDTPIIKLHIWLGNVYQKQRLFPKAEKFYDKAMAGAAGRQGKEELYLEAASAKAYIFSKKYQPLRAIREFQKLLPLAGKLYGRESREYGNLLMDLGIDFYKIGDYYRSEQEFLQALSIFQKVAKPNSVDFNRIYSNLGVNYRKAGDYPRALEYARKALDIKLQNYPADHPSVAKYYMNIGKIYLDMGDPERALPNLETALRIEQKGFPENHPDVAGVKGEVAHALADLGRYEEALNYYSAMEKVDPKYMDPDHPYILASYANIAQVLLETKQYEAAEKIHKKALRKLEKRSYVPPAKRTQMLLLLCDIYSAQGLTTKAIKVAKEGIWALSDPFQKESQLIPNPQNVLDKRLFLEISGRLLQLFQKNGEWEKGFEVAEKSVEAIHLLRRDYQSNEARLFLNKETRSIFDLAVQTAFNLYQKTGNQRYLEAAFRFSEDAKANILKQAIGEGLALRSAHIPESLLDSLDNLKFSIASLENELEESAGSVSSSTDSMPSLLFEKKEAYRELVRYFEHHYPAYYQLKFSYPEIAPKTLQEKLGIQSTLLISCYLAEEHLYGFVIDEDVFWGFSDSTANTLADVITNLRRYLIPEAVLSFEHSDFNDFENLIHDLYQCLLAPVEKKIRLENYRSILFIPHGVLHYLPFDLLRSGADQPYLVERTATCLAPAASIWLREESAQRKPEIPFSGFAPTYDSLGIGSGRHAGFSRLLWNQSEVEIGGKIFGGQIFSGKAATEQTFKNQVAQSGILHLAMHADVNDFRPMQSGLLFTPGADSLENGFLNLHELYKMAIPAHTVILNACNTGYGKLAAGDGVVSLSHAFAHAGSTSILFNLWLADDQASSQIVEAFLLHLKAGMPKVEALRKAKIEYLLQADPLRSHPYFWAGLVLHTQAEHNTFPKIRIVGIAFILIVSLGWFFAARKRI